MKKANQTIRERAKITGIHLWQIADRLGTTDTYFSKLLRKELPEDKQEQIIAELEQEAG